MRMTKQLVAERGSQFQVSLPKSWNIGKMRSRIQRAKEEMVKQVQAVVDEHDRHRGVYFWTPRGNSSQRTAAGYDRNFYWSFGGHKYSVRQYYHESCRNVYYRLEVWVDGNRKTVAALRKLVGAIWTADV